VLKRRGQANLLLEPFAAYVRRHVRREDLDDDPTIERVLGRRQPEAGAQIDDGYESTSDLDEAGDIRWRARYVRRRVVRFEVQHLIGRHRVARGADAKCHVETHPALSWTASPSSLRSSTSVGRPSPRSVAPAIPTERTSGSSTGRTTTS